MQSESCMHSHWPEVVSQIALLQSSSAQTLFLQYAVLLQSASISQLWSSEHSPPPWPSTHEPPQSVSVSSPFVTWSSHPGATQREVFSSGATRHSPLWQSAPS